MITTYAKTRLEQLEEDLTLFEELGIPAVKKLTGQLNSISGALADLKNYLKSNGFLDLPEEIEFFKLWKPKFKAWRIYLVEKFAIEQHKPLGQDIDLRCYFEQELHFTRKLFEKHQFIYQYYLLDSTDLDEVFFSRSGRPYTVIVPDADDFDPDFSAPCDDLFAHFMAAEHLQADLLGQLYPPSSSDSTNRIALQWTGDKINLLELAYAIYDTAQINHGQVDVVDILTWLEQSLNISLHRHYRMFSEMKNRKSISPTRYLDHAILMVKEHLRAGDEFRPRPPKPVSGSKSIK